MESNLINIRKYLAFAGLLFITTFTFAQRKKVYKDYFHDNSPLNWYANDNFTLLEKDSTLIISVNKHPWEAVSLKLDEFDFGANPYLYLKIKASSNFDLRIDIHDNLRKDIDDNGYVSTVIPSLVERVGSQGRFESVFFDFSDYKYLIESNRVSHLLLYFDPGFEFRGKVLIKEFLIGEPALKKNQAETLSPHPIRKEFYVYPNPVNDWFTLFLPKSSEYKQVVIKKYLGETVYDIKLKSKRPSIDFNSDRFDSGIYVIYLFDESGKSISTKFFKN